VIIECCRQRIEPILKSGFPKLLCQSFYFIDLEERMEKGAHIISVVVHREPSVTIGDCEKLTRAILPLLESFPWYGDNDHLEVTARDWIGF